mgnify:CR=1 FL=1|tara:strand:- start:79348 stop:79746 length:399 start_codon:yes stop_codon:yes gene_type:complete
MKVLYIVLLLGFLNPVLPAAAQVGASAEAYERAKAQQSTGAAQQDATRDYLEAMRNNPASNAPTAQHAQPNGETMRSEEFSRSVQAKKEISAYWQNLSSNGRAQYCDEIRPGCLQDHIGQVCQFYYAHCFKK